MSTPPEFGPAVPVEVLRIRGQAETCSPVHVAAEVPCTIAVNGQEAATLLCSPMAIEDLARGFLFTSGLIRGASDITAFWLDERTWRADVTLVRTPDLGHLGRRLYTSGCGRGVVYSGVLDLAARTPLDNDFRMPAAAVDAVMKWFQTCSALHRDTGGVHTAAVCPGGRLPAVWFDDIGRHNAADKAIGRALADGTDLGKAALALSGRVSSEILHKAKWSGIPIVIALGAPTHQAVLRARDMRVTLAGRARGSGFVVYATPERIHPRGAAPGAGEPGHDPV
jgi:FdhD protein